MYQVIEKFESYNEGLDKWELVTKVLDTFETYEQALAYEREFYKANGWDCDCQIEQVA